jgi:hypothetical protein
MARTSRVVAEWIRFDQALRHWKKVRRGSDYVLAKKNKTKKDVTPFIFVRVMKERG